jgi:two-component system, NtrC family, sensor kinase
MSNASTPRPAVDADAGTSLSRSDRELIAESIPHIEWMVALDGSIEYLNRRGIEYTGFSPEADDGWGWAWLVHPDDADPARRAWEQGTRTGAPYEAEYRIRRADGQFRWHAFRALPITDERGAVLRWIGTATDIESGKR